MTDTNMPPPTYENDEERLVYEALNSVKDVYLDVIEMTHVFNEEADTNNMVIQKKHLHFKIRNGIIRKDSKEYNFELNNNEYVSHKATEWLDKYKHGGAMPTKFLEFLYKYIIKGERDCLAVTGELTPGSFVDCDMDVYDTDRGGIHMINHIVCKDVDNNKVNLLCK